MTSASRVLVLGDFPVGYANGIGETLSNLLSTWDPATVVQAYPAHLEPSPRWTGAGDLRFAAPRPPEGWSGWGAACYRPVLKVRQLAARRRLVAGAARLIHQQGVQAVLTYPVTPWVLSAAVHLRRALPKVRFVFYVMDDWEGLHTCFGLPFTPGRRAALREMIETADARFACSHVMQRDYEQRFRTPWGVLHKGVAVSAAPPAPAWAPFADILYTGGMNVFRFDAVVAFAEGVRRFREQSGRNVTLTLLGPAPDGEYAAGLAHFDFIRTEPWMDNDACQRRMADADLLYLPLSFRDKLARIADLAMPTKLPEYLASGRPTIFHVPPRSEVQRLAGLAGLPLTLNSVNAQDACDLLTRLDRDGLDLADYQVRARRLLEQEFDQDVLRQRLADALIPVDADRANVRGSTHE